MKNVLIIGARGFGREINTFLNIQENYKTRYKVKGFLDDNKSALDGFDGYAPIISSVEDYIIEEDDVFFCALGDPKYRKKYVDMILSRGGEFISCISDNAFVLPNTKIGKGVFIGAFSCVDVDVEIQDFTAIFDYCSIGHDSKIGRFCEIEPYVAIGGGAVIGDSVVLHPRVTVLPRIEILENSKVGVASVVTCRIPSNSTVFGNPAVVLKI